MNRWVVAILFLGTACGGGGGDRCGLIALNTSNGQPSFDLSCSGGVEISISNAEYDGLGRLTSFSFSVSCTDGSDAHSGSVTRIGYTGGTLTCFDATIDGQTCNGCPPIPDAGVAGAPPCQDFAGAGLVNDVAFSPDSTRIATVHNDDTLRLWDLAGATELWSQPLVEGRAVAFSSDGALLATASVGSADLRDPSDGSVIRSLVGGPQESVDVAISPDGSLVAAADGTGAIVLWNTSDGSLANVLGTATAETVSVAFSPDGLEVASCGADQGVRFWDVGTGTLRADEGYYFNCDSVAFDPTGDTLVVVGSDAGDWVTQFWNVSTATVAREWVDQPAVGTASLSGDGAMIATGHFEESDMPLRALRVRLVSDRSTVIEFQGDPYGGSRVFFAPDGTKVLTNGSGLLRAWCLP